MKKTQYNKLKGRIVEKFGTISNFAENLSFSRITLTNKLNGKFQFTSKEIEEMTEKLEISQEEIGKYFF